MTWWKRLFGSVESKAEANPVSGITRAETNAGSGISTLEELFKVCATHLSAEQDEKYLRRATDQLRNQGNAGSDALADFIAELTACRSDRLGYALAVAEALAPSPKLVSAVSDLSATASLNECIGSPSLPRFRPEIAGEGKIGWTTGTGMRLARMADKVLTKLAPGRGIAEKQGAIPTEDTHPEPCPVPPGDKLAYAKDPKTPPETLAALAAWAFPPAYDDVADTREAIMVLVEVAQNPSTPVTTLEEILRRRKIGFWELTMNPNCPAHILTKIATSQNPFTAQCARKHPNFPK